MVEAHSQPTSEELRQLVRVRELWKGLLATAPDPVILIGEDGLITNANRATTELFGYGQDDLVGNNVSMLMPEPFRSQHDDYIRRYLTTGEAHIIGTGRNVVAERANGTTFPMRLSVSEVEVDGHKTFTGIIHDLTEQYAQEQLLRDANEQLEIRVAGRTVELEKSMVELARSNRDLEQFAYIASHDLQTPLRNVRQGLELLEAHLVETIGHGFDAEAAELNGLVLGAVSRMEKLIKGLLSYSKLERSGRPLDQVVDLENLAQDTLRQLRVDLEEADARVDSTDLPDVTGDETQLRQLLENLIENAVKYRADDRSPEVQITASSLEDEWLISVSDNGVGIDQSQHERVFELFRRAHPGYEGIGLGLALCQRIVERHGGRIWVESHPDSGAVFRFTLPKSAETETDDE